MDQPTGSALRNGPSPSTPEAVQPNVNHEPTSAGQFWVGQYGLNRWDAQRVDATLGFAEKWSNLHHAPVYCGGVWSPARLRGSTMRAQCVHDMRVALENHKIGWAMWNYQENFGVVTKKDGRAVPDPAIVKALGLKMP